MARHVSLIGMMGAGKSSVAPRLAALLERPVVEVDAEIEKQEGMPIGEIFIAKGEAYFRRVEREYIAALVKQPAAVLSLGGGAFMWEATRNLLLAETDVVYLSASLDTLVSRLTASRQGRPLLNIPGVDLRETVRELLERRGAIYGLAPHRVENERATPDEIAHRIAERLQTHA
jgi:shikimate kinase